MLVLLLLGSRETYAQQPTNLPVYNSSTPVNYIRTWTATAPTTDAAGLPLKGLNEVKEATQYFDGLGRPLQTVLKKGALATNGSDIQDTSGAKDLVTPVLYDAFGREQYQFAPFAANSAGGNTSLSDGQFKLNPFAQHQQFMEGRYGSQGEDNYYSQTVFEASPLSRVMEQFAPGKSWAGSYQGSTEETRHSIKNKYWANTAADAVRIWTVANGTPGSTISSSYTTSGTYLAGMLYKNVTADEQGKQVIAFKDKEGQVILKKVQLTAAKDNGTGSGHAGWLCTYYIYDDLGNLRCVIQPEGVKTMNDAASWTLTSTLLAEQCFRYEYDGWQRMIVKQVPGAGAVVMVYDVRDRLVMTQDGNLRSQGNWNYTQYDNLNRPVRTGLVNLGSSTPNTHWTAAMSKTGDTNSAIQYPEAGMLTNATVLTETFYDGYDWVTQSPHSAALPSGFSDYDNSLDAGNLAAADNPNFPYEQKNTKDTRTKGLVTGMRVNILGTPDYIYTLTIYDNKARPIQVKTKNQTTGIDLVTTQYSWSGQPLTIVSRESKASGAAIAVTTVTKNTYDVLGRLVKTTKNVSSSTGLSSGDKIIAVNKYDELGQLVGKTLGATDANGTAGAETQAYEYNVRGWLLGMNRGYVNNSQNTSSFGFDLAYDKINNLPGTANYTKGMYNGNITGMTWRGKTGSAEIRRYDYDYDAANRILKGDFKDFTNTANNTAFDIKMGNGINPEQAYGYNGNIKTMQQYGLYQGSKRLIDNLSYTYKENGLSNKLAAVTDGGVSTAGLGDFNNGVNSGDDYTYDTNGNLTKDANKNISGISYNILNLPQQIDVTGQGTISYQYDAAGNKLSKTVDETGQGQKVTTYLGGMIFENDVLQHVAMEEGRFRPNGSVFTADYFLKDHLGNVRAMINENGTLLEETHYYPFGLTMRGISTQNATPSLHNKDKTFQGQKFDDDLGVNYYSFKYRNHDPQIGRFIQLDPLADDYPHNSTYAFSENRVVNGVELEGLEYMTYSYNEAGVRANQQATAQRSTQRARSGAMRTFDKGLKLAGGLTLTTKSPVGLAAGGILLIGTTMVVLMQEALEGEVKEGGKDPKENKILEEKKDNTYNRVKPRKKTLEKVNENQPRNDAGEMVDPNTGEPLVDGETDLGHKPGNEWRKRQQMHKERGSSRKEVIEAENDPDLYQYEGRSNNRGHKYEKKDN
ncbi:DUF6443 domain-containing protein [Niabella drilacis]|nr:DUF6443 domain-containing protein [Niabella drilacis]